MPYKSKEDQHNWCLTNKERLRPYKRIWAREHQRPYKYEPYNEVRSASRKVHYALKTGELEWWPCEVCGSYDVRAHHEDYSKPLEVRWLCPLHHKELHINAKTRES